MAEKLFRKETVTFEELLTSNVIEQEALINLLEKKGVITKVELLQEIKESRKSKSDQVSEGANCKIAIKLRRCT